jgi:DNA-directed RNA polymerase specialized sigma24 family protein
MSLLHLEGQGLEETARLTGNSNLAIRLIAFRARRKMKKAFLRLQQGERK